VVTSREGPGAEVTLEGLVAGVFPVVSGQLIGPGKFPLAAFPRASVGLLPRVGPLVGFQVGAFGVDFVAPRMVALVDAALFQKLVDVQVSGSHQIPGDRVGGQEHRFWG